MSDTPGRREGDTPPVRRYELKDSVQALGLAGWIVLDECGEVADANDVARLEAAFTRQAEEIARLRQHLEVRDTHCAAKAVEIDVLTAELRSAESQVQALQAENERLVKDLAECYRLTGADPDGNDDRALAPLAVVEVRRLRDEEAQASMHADDLAKQVQALRQALEDAARVLHANGLVGDATVAWAKATGGKGPALAHGEAAPPPEPRYTRAEVVAEILRYRREGSTTYTDIFNNALEILAERVFPPEAAPKETQEK